MTNQSIDATVLKLSEVKADNRVFRIDAQYFGRASRAAEAKIATGRFELLLDVAQDIESFGAYDLTNYFSYVEEGVPFLRCLNIKGGFVDFSNSLYITAVAHKLLSKSEVRPGMVLLTMSGSVGNAAVALPSWHYPVNSNQDVAKITPADSISPFYLAAFLNSRFGQAQMERLPVGSVQQHIFLWMIERLKIARFGEKLETAIAKMAEGAYALESKSGSATAEHLLLSALGLENWQPPEPLTYKRRASEAFAVGRFDAEYFQEQYFALAKRLQSFPYKQLGEICPSPINGVEIREYQESGVPYLRVGDVQHFAVDLDSVMRVSPAAAADEIEKVRLQTGDVLVSRSGSLGVTGVVEESWKHAVISSHLIRVRITDAAFDPYYVAAFLAAKPGLMQIQQRSNGGVQPEINQPSLKSILIPCLATERQKEIRSAILSGHAARRSAHEMLERAKRVVEIAIEQSESAALRFLQQ